MSDAPTTRKKAESAVPVRAESLRTQIHSGIRDLIQRGEIGPDERLVDLEIAARFGVSRMPAREALMQLVHEGYLEGTTRGFMLPQLSSADVAEIFEIRRLLEPRAAASAAQRMDVEGQALLDAALGTAKKAVENGDSSELMFANAEFRRGWLEHVPNRRLAATIGRFADQVQTVRQATLFERSIHPVVLDGLEKLHSAFRQQDVSSVHDHMLSYIVQAETQFFTITAKMAEKKLVRKAR